MNPSKPLIAGLTWGLVLIVAGCGSDSAAPGVEGQARGIEAARDAQASASLSIAQTQGRLLRGQSGSFGSSASSFATELAATGAGVRFGTEASAGPDQVQVLGGGAQPAMYVVRSESGAYLALWDDGTATRSYSGQAPPAYSPAAPSGPGWTGG